MSKAEQAVAHLVGQMQRDGRLAYLLGWPSQSWRLLIDAEAERLGISAEEMAQRVRSEINPVRIVEA